MAPKYTKTIICLANSRKITGRCVTGKEIGGGKVGGWIRPISARPTGELSEEDRRFENGQDPKLLDVVRIPMADPQPHGFQTENHLIDDGYYWTKEREASWDELQAAVDKVSGALWDNSSSSTYGHHDRVEEEAANKLGNSLRLVEVKDLKIVVAVEGAEFGNAKRRVRGRFTCPALLLRTRFNLRRPLRLLPWLAPCGTVVRRGGARRPHIPQRSAPSLGRPLRLASRPSPRTQPG